MTLSNAIIENLYNNGDAEAIDIAMESLLAEGNIDAPIPRPLGGAPTGYRTLLYVAVQHSRTEQVEKLLKAGANPNFWKLPPTTSEPVRYDDPMVHSVGFTVSAVQEKALETLRLLLRHGYEVEFPIQYPHGPVESSLFKYWSVLRTPKLLEVLDELNLKMSHELHNESEPPLFVRVFERADPESIYLAFKLGMRVVPYDDCGPYAASNPYILIATYLRHYNRPTREAAFDGMMEYQCQGKIPIIGLPGWTLVSEKWENPIVLP